MTGAQLEAFIRAQTGMNANKVTQDQLFQYVNIAREKIRSQINDRVNEKFWFAKFTGDTVSGTNTYDIASLTGTGELFDIDDVEVKWSDDDIYHSLVDSGQTNDSGLSRGDLGDMITEPNALWVYENNNIVLYPTPQNSVTDGLYVYGSYTFSDIDATSVEGTIYPSHPELKGYEYVVALGVIPFMERQRNIKDKNDINNSEQVFQNELDMMIDFIKSKYNSVVYGALPDNSYYKS